MSDEIDSTRSTVKRYDYVIVGAGPSAMGILRGLLEEISKTRVLTPKDNSVASFSIAIVERGEGPPHDEATVSPQRWYEASNPSRPSAKSVRLFSSDIMGRVMDLPVGQGLGGTSNINACLCLPPLEQDLESWPEPYKSSLRPNSQYLKGIMEEYGAIHQMPIGDAHHPFSGNSSILEFGTTVPTLARFDDAAAGFVRTNYFDSLVQPILMEYPFLETHLRWFRGCEAQRVLLEDHSTRVVGIECMSNGPRDNSVYRKLYANRRVILCAGAVETPALLLVSDLGDKEPLFGVGQNLKDQPLLGRVFFKPRRDKPRIRSSNGIAALGHLNITGGSRLSNEGLFQVAITDSISNYIIPSIVASPLRRRCQTNILKELFEFAFHYIKTILKWAILCTPLGFVLDRFTTTTMIFLMHPRSRGSVTISHQRSKEDIARGPKRRQDVTVHVDPRYMDDPRDKQAMKSAWDAFEKVTASSSFELFPRLVFSPLKLFSKSFWFGSYCTHFLQPYYHFSGTCRMLVTIEGTNNPNWVVDASLKLRGHSGLYICDASVFPSMISNPPALTCAALGYGFSQTIVAEDKRRRRR